MQLNPSNQQFACHTGWWLVSPICNFLHDKSLISFMLQHVRKLHMSYELCAVGHYLS